MAPGTAILFSVVAGRAVPQEAPKSEHCDSSTYKGRHASIFSHLQVTKCHHTAGEEQAKEGLLCLLAPQGT